MTTIAAGAAGPADLPPATRRVDADNQRDAWLRQMELAQLAGMDSSPALAAPAPAPAHAARVAGATLAPPAAQVVTRPSAPDRATPAAVTQAVPDGAPADDVPADAGAQPVDGAGIAAPAALAMAAPARPLPPDPSSPDAVVPDIAAALPAALQAAAAAGNPAPGTPTAAGTPPSPATASLPVLAPAAGAAPAWHATMPAAPAPEAPEPDPGPDTGEIPDWHKRVMHLTGDGDDVQLWIRDGDLSSAQAQQLVARVAGDVAAMGLRLKEATVNGKPALRTARADAAPPAFAAAVSEAFIQPITHPTTER